MCGVDCNCKRIQVKHAERTPFLGNIEKKNKRTADTVKSRTSRETTLQWVVLFRGTTGQQRTVGMLGASEDTRREQRCRHGKAKPR
jgi:hypothetical protein